MRTKTGQLLMEKLKNRAGSPVPAPPEPTHYDQVPSKEEVRPPKKQLQIQSHLNEYKFVNIVNRGEESSPSREDFKSLEIQNLRLIEDNMMMSQWSHSLLNQIRQGIMRGIQAIEEFRYLQGVNLLYSLMTDLTQQGDEFKLPARSKLIAQSQVLKKLGSHPANTLSLNMNKVEVRIDPSSMRNNEVQPRMKEEKREREEEVWVRMLMVQSLGLQSMIDHRVWYS